MLFTIRRLSRPAQCLGDTATGIRPGLHANAIVAGLMVAGLLLCATSSRAQQAPQAQYTPAAATTIAPPLAAASAAVASDDSDPVSRFLAEKRLLPNTKPVVELAQQMREKATDVASELVLSAMNFLGVPYRRGGSSEQNGFDCSGFTRHVFENSVGLLLPRRAIEQANSPDLIAIQKSELKPGDLVFFNTLRRTFSHVGIYIGDDKFIHSPRTGGKVRVEDMRQAYWQQRFDGARRAPLVSAHQSKGTQNN
jgi:cell wall-associated NlpC family hydrolase